jgi:hypothetical protein
MARKPAASKPSKPQTTRPQATPPRAKNPLKDTLQDIGRGSRALVDQGKAAGRNIASSVRKIKRFTNG